MHIQDDWLYIDAFHGMTDGNGIFNLIRTLLFYYCKEAFDSSIEPGKIRLVGDDSPSEELNDPYLSLPPRDKVQKKEGRKNRKAQIYESCEGARF